jgi:hypothetical protein
LKVYGFDSYFSFREAIGKAKSVLVFLGIIFKKSKFFGGA